MRLIPKLFPCAVLLLLLVPIQSGGQSGFFNTSEEDVIIRKAKGYNLVPVDKAIFVDMRTKSRLPPASRSTRSPSLVW